MTKTQALTEFYLQNGFGIIRNVFSKDEVAKLRREMIRIFDTEPKNSQWDSASVRANPFERYPELRKLFANRRILAALKEVLGQDSVLIWGGSIHDSSVKGGWHKDTNALEAAGNDFHYSPDCHLVTVAVYLQDNCQDFGGGLDIVPGSHKRRETWWEKVRAGNRKVKFVLSHLDKRGLLPAWVLHKRKGAMAIPSVAGDVVFFNMKCDHRPTHATASSIPAEHRKLALFFSAAKNNECLPPYLRFLKTVVPEGMATQYGEAAYRELTEYGAKLAQLS